MLGLLLLAQLVIGEPDVSIADTSTGPYISTVSEDGQTTGVFVDRELSPPYRLSALASTWLLRGTTEEEQIANLETDVATSLDSLLSANGVTQRVRIRVERTDPLTYTVCVASSAAVANAARCGQ